MWSRAAGRDGLDGMTIRLEHAVLSRLPKPPHKIDTRSLLERLRGAGIRTNMRALQRLLVKLEADRLVSCDASTKPYQWSWGEEQHVEFPPMSAETALSVLMAQEHLRHLLPPPTLDDLKPRARRAEQVLASSKAFRSWRSKVTVVPRGLAVVPPAIEPEVVRTVYRALFEARQLTADYKLRGKCDYRRFDINPLGLVVREGVVSLISTRSGTTRFQQLHLHRMRAPSLTTAKVIVPTGFDLQRYVAQGKAAYVLAEEPIALELLVSSLVADTLSEVKLAQDQALEPAEDGRYRVRATVRDTIDLRGWLKSYGPHVEVVGPGRIREEIRAELAQAVARYLDR